MRIILLLVAFSLLATTSAFKHTLLRRCHE